MGLAWTSYGVGSNQDNTQNEVTAHPPFCTENSFSVNGIAFPMNKAAGVT